MAKLAEPAVVALVAICMDRDWSGGEQFFRRALAIGATLGHSRATRVLAPRELRFRPARSVRRGPPHQRGSQLAGAVV
jgi:hypothetical protein